MPQKLLLALLVASRKLRHYFQGHPIKVISAYPLERVLRSPNSAGRLVEWNIELQAFQLEFSTTRVVKGTALANSVAEWTEAPGLEAGEDRSLSRGSEAPDGWVMYFDGAFSRHGAGAGAVLVSPTMDKLYYAMQLCFQHGEKVSNNIAEYEGLIAGLKAAAALGLQLIALKFELRLLIHKTCNGGFDLLVQLRGYLHEILEHVLHLDKAEGVILMAGRTLINIRMKITTMIHVSQLNQVAERKKK
ncbi:uncharacterized protein [Aegilops tauschii subsp. strangulata]|uniref:uncharacterized protein n=1 Tax=Aegilops tauschii subsp. strangulata TaxID=200361 RepID=UPI00098B97C8|nr:uncharacterized protein LOC109736060 [Aegilops tauschii subsp. strangulata]